MSTPSTSAGSDHDTIAAVRRQILASLRAGRKLGHAHKEGGTTVDWKGDRFVVEDYDDCPSRREFTNEAAFLAARQNRNDWTASQKTCEPRALHRSRVEPAGSRLRITDVDAISGEPRADGALVRAEPGRGPLVLDSPGSVLVTYRTGSVVSPDVGLARIDLDGHTLWTFDTGLREFAQVLPGSERLVLVGTLPAPEGRVPEPVVVVDSRGENHHIRTLHP